jgi:geranylgeranyl diphosphate synthase, type I
MMLSDSLIREIDRRIARLFPPDTSRAALLYDMTRYHLGWIDEELRPAAADPGKRVRPRLCLLSCAAAGASPAKALPPATAVELIHNFSLVHDDIQDRSEYRRHRRTVWNIWGTSQAINAGDGMFALAQLALAEDETTDPATVVRAIRELNRACRALCEGQVLDLQFEGRSLVDVEEYYAMIEGKTAALLAASCRMGALYGGAGEAATEGYARFGKHLGLAFQVRDDYLGIWGDPRETGKPSASDLISKKKTLPLLYALSTSAGSDRALIESILSEPGTASDEQARELLALLTGLGAAEYAAREVDRLTRTALEALASTDPQDPAGEELAGLCRSLSFRTR